VLRLLRIISMIGSSEALQAGAIEPEGS